MSGAALPEYVQALLDPAAYPHAPAEVELRQTHISRVFLAGDVVYKTKKPVDFGFISQLDAETRARFCHAELRLNRRLAPGVYLGVVPVVRMPDGRFAVEGDPAAARSSSTPSRCGACRTSARSSGCSRRARRQRTSRSGSRGG